MPEFKIPGLLIKTSPAGVRTTAHKEGDPDAGSVCYIRFFDLAIVHAVSSALDIRHIIPEFLGTWYFTTGLHI